MGFRGALLLALLLPSVTAQCSNTCAHSNDGDCDDGGPGAQYTSCSLGTDCGDCGSRTSPPPPLAPPPLTPPVSYQVRDQHLRVTSCVLASSSSANIRCCHANAANTCGSTAASICDQGTRSLTGLTNLAPVGHAAALNECAAHAGWRLCTIDELSSGVCYNTGCSFNNAPVWNATALTPL
jgi:hypothetical protein